MRVGSGWKSGMESGRVDDMGRKRRGFLWRESGDLMVGIELNTLERGRGREKGRELRFCFERVCR